MSQSLSVLDLMKETRNLQNYKEKSKKNKTVKEKNKKSNLQLSLKTKSILDKAPKKMLWT